MNDDTPPAAGEDHVAATGYKHEDFPDQRRFGTRGRRISWIAGIVAIAVVIALILLVARHSASNQATGGYGGGRHGGRHGGGGGSGGGMNNMPTTVGTAKAATADLPVTIEALGTVTPEATVTVRPQVSGTITQILFREGAMVRKGQPIAVIDPRPYRAALLQAQGALVRDQAQLANARLLLQRDQTLLSEDSIARQDVDTQAALVKQLVGTIDVDKGQVQQAQINLGYTRIVSPVAGRIGLKVVDIGNYVGAGDTTGVAVVTTLQPIDVEFAIPQGQAPEIEKRVAHGATIPALALDAARTSTLDTGRFLTLDNQVDTTTGTIKGKARFPNAGFQLYPSQFVNVQLTVDTVANAIVVPPAAIRSGQNGNFVWLLNADRTVSQRAVKTGVTTATQVQVTDGLAVGDTVVTDGGDRLTDGSKVRLPGDKLPPMGQGGQRSHGGHGGHGGWRHRHGQGGNQQQGAPQQNGQQGGRQQGGGRGGQAQGG